MYSQYLHHGNFEYSFVYDYSFVLKIQHLAIIYKSYIKNEKFRTLKIRTKISGLDFDVFRTK